MTSTPSLNGSAPVRHDRHGHWIAQAGIPEARQALADSVDADVVVLGGGYTGMWAAWHVRALEPSARVVLLEADVCGLGPSGRNGGFVNALWFSLPKLRDRFGDEGAIAMARASQSSIDRVGEWCAEQGIDAHFRQAGYIQAAAAPAQQGSWRPVLEACRELGEPDQCVELSPAELAERCASPIFGGGAYFKGGGNVDPARLAFGLRRRLVEEGVEIFEHSPVIGVAEGPGGVTVRTPGGEVRADAAVLGLGTALGRVPPLRRRLTLTSSHVVATEPVPDVIAELGWTRGESVTDSRAMIHYFRTTADDRIVFGWGGGKVVSGTRSDERIDIDPEMAGAVHRDLLRFFPQLVGRRIGHAWGGPIDVSPTHLPVVATLPGGTAHCAFGYTGNGVGPSQLAGRALASLALDRDDWARNLAFVNPPAITVPPEPFRYLGGTLIRRAILRAEEATERGKRLDPATALLAALPEKLGIHVSR